MSSLFWTAAPEGSVEENLVQEIDPNEGPYQVGFTNNMDW